VINLNDDASREVYSVRQREHDQSIFSNLENVLDENLFIACNFQLWVVLVGAESVEVKKLLWPVVALLIENVLIVMEPFFLFEVNLPRWCFTRELDAPETFIINEEMHRRVDGREHLSLIHRMRNDIRVKYLAHELQLDNLADG